MSTQSRLKRVQREILNYKTDQLEEMERFRGNLNVGSHAHRPSNTLASRCGIGHRNGQLRQEELDDITVANRHRTGSRGADALVAQLRTELGRKRNADDRKSREEKMRRVRGILRESRARTVRTRRYYEEMQLGLRAKMMISAESHVNDEMNTEKVHEAHRQEKISHHEERFEREAIENRNLDRLESLTEDFAKEVRDLRSDIKESRKTMADKKREERKKMVEDIRRIQSDVLRISREKH